MAADIEQVTRLQSLDLKIAELEREVATLPKHIAQIEKALDSHLRRLEADRAALAANQKERKRLEDDAKVESQKISKLKDQMLGAKTNEQYRAFQHEITFCEDSIRKAEDRILDLMSEAEPLDVNVKKAEAALKEEKQTVEAEKTRARERTAVDQKQLEQLRAERKTPGGGAKAANLPGLRTHPQEMARSRGGRSLRWTMWVLPDCSAPAVFPGSAAQRGVDVL